MIGKSDKFKQEYCCTVVKIGECFPIEGADRIQRTLVNGMDMVISKDIKPGDIMIYAGNETQLNSEFLSKNNLYGIGDYELNSNAQEVQRLIDEGKNDEAKQLCGFFTKHGRVKLLKLKGTYSFGFLFKPVNLYIWRPDAKQLNFESMIGQDFDTFMGEVLVKAYIPVVKKPRNSGTGKPIPKGQRFDRLLDETFPFNYDSMQLQRNIHKLNYDDTIAITVKMHGTSAVFRRTDCKIPVSLKWWQKAINSITKLFGREIWQAYTIGQDNLYASRTVLRNRYQNPKDKMSVGSQDVYGYFNNIIGPFLEDNTTVYGEIYGYMPGEGKFIQKPYDYGCDTGECKFMPYRVVRNGYEFDVEDVLLWTHDMVKAHPELRKHIDVMPLLYHGSIKELYPIEESDGWRDKLLQALKTDVKNFCMEQMEPLCKNKVPREGICIRIDGCPEKGNFKLKCSKFLDKESKNVDAGEIDMESLEVAES